MILRRALTLHILVALVHGGVASATPVFNPANGHHYELIEDAVQWTDARALAEARTHNGSPGYLATLTSFAENQFVIDALGRTTPGFAWIGGSDADAEGAWRWVTGPEAGIRFSQERTPVAPFNFAPWGVREPNNFGAGEHFAGVQLGPATFDQTQQGQWGDASGTLNFIGYLVEYGAAPVGDYNGSGQVDQGDLDLVLQHWGAPGDPLPIGWVQYVPGAAVEQSDLDSVLGNWGETAVPTLRGATSVPEPLAGVALMLAWYLAFTRSVRTRVGSARFRG